MNKILWAIVDSVLKYEPISMTKRFEMILLFKADIIDLVTKGEIVTLLKPLSTMI